MAGSLILLFFLLLGVLLVQTDSFAKRKVVLRKKVTTSDGKVKIEEKIIDVTPSNEEAITEIFKEKKKLQKKALISTEVHSSEESVQNNDTLDNSTRTAHTNTTIKPSDAPAFICVVMRNEDLYVDEWIQYNKYLGFDWIHIIDNNQNGSAKLGYLPQRYGKFIRVEHVPGESIQLPGYKSCVKQYLSTGAWAAFLDVDEFIVLRRHPNVKALLRDIVPKGGALSLNRICFGSNGHMQFENRPVLERFTTRRAEIDIFVKTISFLPHTTRVSAHYTVLLPGLLRVDTSGRETHQGSTHPNGTDDVAAIHHYNTKSLAEFKLKRLRGDAFSYRRGEKYRAGHGEAIILTEFAQLDNSSNAVQDTTALDFFRKKVVEVGPVELKLDIRR